jgi:hypothetical protein
MELWLRHKKASNPAWDEKVSVSSAEEWREIIYNPNLVSSVLWPIEPLFPIEGKYLDRHHEHEKKYRNDPERNASYLKACRALASGLRRETEGSRCLVYAPLRGALPIWRTIGPFLSDLRIDVYHPVTSSFVFFPQEFRVFNRKGRPASALHNHYRELERLRPFLSNYDYLLYIDEIISGGGIHRHLRMMKELGIHKDIPIIVAGLADRFGERSRLKRKLLEREESDGHIRRFLWEGCAELITEDQKFLLGIHYVDYSSGPHVIPVLNHNLMYYEEKMQLEKDLTI